MPDRGDSAPRKWWKPGYHVVGLLLFLLGILLHFPPLFFFAAVIADRVHSALPYTFEQIPLVFEALLDTSLFGWPWVIGLALSIRGIRVSTGRARIYSLISTAFNALALLVSYWLNYIMIEGILNNTPVGGI